MRRWRGSVIEALVKRHGWTRGAELGVLRGDLFFWLLDTCPELHMIGVDTWLPGDPALDVAGRDKRTERDTGYRSYDDAPLDIYAAQVMAQAELYGARARLLRMDTMRAAYEVPGASLDFVFIDADHTETGVRCDIEVWRPKLKPGGWLLGHDADFPSVQRALVTTAGHWQAHEGQVWSCQN